MRRIKAFFAKTGGATSIEYCLIAAAISVAIIAAVSAVGEQLKTPFEKAAAGMASGL